jgi:predicted metal-dependent phosphoesterase TrpH
LKNAISSLIFNNMENLKLITQLATLAVLGFGIHQLSNAFGALDRAEKHIKSAIDKIEAADAKIVQTQTLLHRLDSLTVVTQAQVKGFKQEREDLEKVFKKALAEDRQRLTGYRKQLDSIYGKVKNLPNF